jgi:hypothetical protein
MLLLTEFLLRLAFGLAGGMSLVSPRDVTSGYFRNHLYVTLGLSALAALLARTAAPHAFWPAAAAAVLSYVGSVAWLYERPKAGKLLLAAVLLAAMYAAVVTQFTLWESQGRHVTASNGDKHFEISTALPGFVRTRRRRRTHLDDLAYPRHPQHAERHGHPLRRGHRHIRRRNHVAATVCREHIPVIIAG